MTTECQCQKRLATRGPERARCGERDSSHPARIVKLELSRRSNHLRPGPCSSLIAYVSPAHRTDPLGAYLGHLLGRRPPEGFVILAQRPCRDEGRAPGTMHENTIHCWDRGQDDVADLESAIEAVNPGLLHINLELSLFAPAFYDLLYELARSGTRILVTLHGSADLAPNRAALEGLHRSADRILVPAPETKTELEAAGFDPDAIWVIPHGSYESHPEAQQPLAALRKRFAFRDGVSVVSTFGLAGPYDGMRELIAAMAQVMQHIQAELHIFRGPCSSASRQEAHLRECLEEAQRLGISGNVRVFSASLPDWEVQSRLRASDALVLNYRSADLQACAVVNSIACLARPIVATRAPCFCPVSDAVLRTSRTLPLAQAVYAVLSNQEFARKLSCSAGRYHGKHRMSRVRASVWRHYEKLLGSAGWKPNYPIAL